jgi:hypothetical protein
MRRWFDELDRARRRVRTHAYFVPVYGWSFSSTTMFLL